MNFLRTLNHFLRSADSSFSGTDWITVVDRLLVSNSVDQFTFLLVHCAQIVVFIFEKCFTTWL